MFSIRRFVDTWQANEMQVVDALLYQGQKDQKFGLYCKASFRTDPRYCNFLEEVRRCHRAGVDISQDAAGTHGS
jgi:hypothetical protein